MVPALKKAIKLLREAKNCIGEELSTCGEQELEHPVLKGHSDVYDKIEEFLKTYRD